MSNRKKIKRKKYIPKRKVKVIKKGFPLTEKDQVTYIYKQGKNLEVLEVTSVSYEAIINNKVENILYYDSSHGYLHRHIRISLENKSYVIDDISKQGSHHSWLTTAVEDLKAHFLEYRKQFFERSEVVDNYN